MSEIFHPHPRQELVLLCPCNEILYGGTAGAGKSFAIIFSWVQHERIYGKHAKGLIIRKTNPELEDLVGEFRKVFAGMEDPPKWNETKRSFVHRSGAVLEMGYLDSESDRFRYHGRAFNFVAWDELTLWPTSVPYDFLLSRTRSAHGIPVRILSTTNPIGPGTTWVKRRWRLDQHRNGMVPMTFFIDLDSGKIEEDRPDLEHKSETTLLSEGYRKWTRIFIPGKLSDNPSLDRDGQYRASLMMQPEHIRKALLDGRWDAIEGAFFSEFDPTVHVIKAFQPHKSWKRWMAMDWGTAKPYCCLWFCENPNGEVLVYDEMYGIHHSGEPDKGCMEPASLVAQKIRERERQRGEIITERYADPSIFSSDGHEVSIDGLFTGEGVIFQPSGRRDKEARVALMRQYLAVTNGMARLRIMDNCIHTIRTLPMLQFKPNNPELYDTDGEDHAADAISYGLWKNPKDIGKTSNLRKHNEDLLASFSEFGAH